VRVLILFFFLFIINLSFGQNGIYDQYYSLEDLYEEKDNLDSLETVFDNHLSKALELNDTIEQLKVLRWKYWYSSNEISQGEILNQLNTISKALNNKREVAANNYLIASKEYYKGDYLNALTLFEKSLDASITANWKNGVIDNILAITGIYRETNRQQDINSFLENTLSDLNKHYPDERNANKYWIYLEIAKNYLDENNLSLSGYYKSLAISGMKLDKTLFNDHIIIGSLIDLKEGNFSKSRDSLVLNLSFFHQSKLPTVYYTIAVALKKLDQPLYSYEYLIKADSILQMLNYPPFTNGSSLYEELVSLTKESDTKNEFIGKLYYYNQSNRDKVGIEITRDEISRLDIFILALVLFLVVFTIYLFIKRTGIKNGNSKSTNIQKPNIRVEKSEIFEKLHKAIQQWTIEKGFLNNNISLSSLATELNTNTAYLSQVFNKNIGVSFSEYISNCRVEYLISEVKKDPELISNKSSIQIAEMAGFMSIDAYNSAFKRHVGKTPRQYFTEIV
jgi:YesN/AraC family two-component response regulator